MARPQLAATDVRPDVRVITADPAATATNVITILAPTHKLFRRGDYLVHVVEANDGKPPAIVAASAASITDLTHQHARVLRCKENEWKPAALPERIAKIVLTRFADFPILRGITASPVLTADGTIRMLDGYDAITGLYGVRPIAIDVPEHPTKDDAAAALARTRERFKTFAFGDARVVRDKALGVNV